MKHSNFNFIKLEWPEIYKTVIEAEKHVHTAPRTAAFYCRLALEIGVRWLYEHDYDLRLPYNDNLSGLMHEHSFQSIMRRSLWMDINYLRKVGNEAAHRTQAIRREEAMASIKNLHRFLNWLARTYGEEDIQPQKFEESLLPKENQHEKKLAELQKIKSRYEQQAKEHQETIKKMLAQTDEMRAKDARIKELEAMIAKVEANKERNIKRLAKEGERIVDVPEVRSEKETRQLYIDLLLREAGWNINDPKAVGLEFEVSGMPSNTGKGYVDYVLWGDDGRPLAVVEAKRSSKDPEIGLHQAKLYADCLEKQFGQRPVIFTSNGFEHQIWDDQLYPARPIQGFYSKDALETLIKRHNTRLDLRKFSPKKEIANRYYQKEAIQRVSDSLMSSGRAVLLVMATGSGKTRTAVALADILVEANWGKRILFLADRTALVKQAKERFDEYLPNLSSINLSKGERDPNARLVFSTYPTLLNRINKPKEDEERYGIGHFDFIVIDEAHRSVYKKYQAIFDYFDAILVGLTATPKSDVDKNTYDLFQCQDQNPTYEYPLEQAIADQYLTPPKAIAIPTRFIEEGIKYNQLSDKEKEEYEEKFYDMDSDEIPEEIDSKALNDWLFNKDTVDKVLAHLMEFGQKIENGDKLGKTIIFAKNQKHADFIEERFNKNYPHYKGSFALTIYNKKSYAQDLIDDFSDPEKMPQIAISVDMLDTGIDVEEVLNLVFFKKVRSHSKYWQMLGRGTRLCEDLFGPGLHKEFFYIFDVCGNIEYFDENIDTASGTKVKSEKERSFELKLNIAQELRHLKHQSNEALQELRKKILDESHAAIQALNPDSVEVRAHKRYYEQFKDRDVWNNLQDKHLKAIVEKLAPLVEVTDKDFMARRFDTMLGRIELGHLQEKEATPHIEKVRNIAKELAKKGNLPQIQEKSDLIMQVVEPGYLEDADLIQLEEVRQGMRSLVKFLDKSDKEIVYTNFEDELVELGEIDMKYGDGYSANYRVKVERFFLDNQTHLTVQKIRNNQPISDAELSELERLLFENTEGNKEQFKEACGEQPLKAFIVSLLGMDIKAAKAAFSEFLEHGNLNANQIYFINQIINYFAQNGVIDLSKLANPPFTDHGNILDLFGEDAGKIVSIIKEMNDKFGGA